MPHSNSNCSNNNHNNMNSNNSNGSNKRKVDEIIIDQPPSIVLAAGNAASLDSNNSAGGNDGEEQQTVRITARKNEFNKEHYWLVDLYAEPPLKQGATPLVRRCMRAYGWDEGYTRRVLKAYRQFLVIKERKRDWNAVLLSPSVNVDEMWQQHILDVNNYIHDCMLLCGHVLGRNPDSDSTSSSTNATSSSNSSSGNSSSPNSSHHAANKKGSRYTRTRMALEEYFEESELDKSIDGVWKEVFHRPERSQQLGSAGVDGIAGSGGVAAAPVAAGIGSNDNNIDVTRSSLIVRSLKEDGGGMEVWFNMKMTSPLIKLFRMYADHTGYPLQYLDFHYNGTRIPQPDITTPQMLGMIPSSQAFGSQFLAGANNGAIPNNNNNIGDDNHDNNNNNNVQQANLVVENDEDDEEDDDSDNEDDNITLLQQQQQAAAHPPSPPIINVYTILNETGRFPTSHR